jgi:hypothetical protein
MFAAFNTVGSCTKTCSEFPASVSAWSTFFFFIDNKFGRLFHQSKVDMRRIAENGVSKDDLTYSKFKSFRKVDERNP